MCINVNKSNFNFDNIFFIKFNLNICSQNISHDKIHHIFSRFIKIKKGIYKN